MQSSVILEGRPLKRYLTGAETMARLAASKERREVMRKNGSLEWGSLCHPSELAEPNFKRESYF